MHPARLLAIGGMVLVLVGLAYGAVHGAFILDSLREGALTRQQEALRRLGAGSADVDAALGEWEQGHQLETVRALNRGAHTHATLMGLTAVVFSPYLTRTGFSRPFRYILALSVLAGALLMPAGMVIDIWAHDIGHAVSLAGGAIFLLSLLVLTWGYMAGRDGIT